MKKNELTFNNIYKGLRSKAEIIIDFTLSLINTIYYLFIPKNNKIVINGFFNKYLSYVKKNNLGDDLNFLILHALTGKKIFSAQNLMIKSPNILFIGSILQKYINSQSIIWGAGTIEEKAVPPTQPHLVRAVRGPLTRRWLIKNNIDCPEVYSDPALLLPLIYPSKVKKKYNIGIIPHYIDWNSNTVKHLCNLMQGYSINVINMAKYKSCESVIDEINKCEHIISSSLHGIIISDAYKIPNIWVEFSNKVAGDGFKFFDYFQSVKRADERPLKLYNMFSIEDIFKNLSEYEKPNINILPLLENAPFNISKDVLKSAVDYYGEK